MMTQNNDNNRNEKSPKPGLIVTVTINPKTQPYHDFIQAAIIEFQGIWIELRQVKKNQHQVLSLFEKVKDGEDFFKMFSNTNLKVEKELL